MKNWCACTFHATYCCGALWWFEVTQHTLVMLLHHAAARWPPQHPFSGAQKGVSAAMLTVHGSTTAMLTVCACLRDGDGVKGNERAHCGAGGCTTALPAPLL